SHKTGLAASECVHRLAGRFVSVVAGEVERLGLTGTLAWEDWERLFDHITLRVIFGDQAREEQALTARLERLMSEANRLVGLSHDDDYYELYAGIERYIREPGPDSLIAQVTGAP